MRNNDKLTRSGIYRSRNGLIFGVCRGLAEHFDFSILWARVIAIIFLLVTGFWPAIGIYLIAALLMKPAPVIPIKTEAEKEFYDSYLKKMGLLEKQSVYTTIDDLLAPVDTSRILFVPFFMLFFTISYIMQYIFSMEFK